MADRANMATFILREEKASTKAVHTIHINYAILMILYFWNLMERSNGNQTALANASIVMCMPAYITAAAYNVCHKKNMILVC